MAPHAEYPSILFGNDRELQVPPNSPANAPNAIDGDIPQLSLASLDIQDAKPTFTILITGCSSSGKSSMAALLGEIFSPATRQEHEMISQDDYFLPKALCPIVTFHSAPEDSEFVRAAVRHDHIGAYYYDSDGYIHGPDCDSDRSIDCVNILGRLKGELHETADHSRQLAHQDEEVRRMCILNEHLVDFMREEVATFVKEQAILNAVARFQGHLIRGPIENDRAASSASTPISKATFRPTFVFVEGFLLLTNDHPDYRSAIDRTESDKTITASPTQASLNRRKSSAGVVDTNGLYVHSVAVNALKAHTQRITEITEYMSQTNEIDDKLEDERSAIMEEIWAVNYAAKEEMQKHYDIKLFLQISKQVAKERRFSRAVYEDVNKGGGRIPGQMWKSQGYFEDVAWKNHLLNHRYLLGVFEEDGVLAYDGTSLHEKRGDVFVCKQDANIWDSVAWAIATILQEMARVEATARNAAGNEGHIDS